MMRSGDMIPLRPCALVFILVSLPTTPRPILTRFVHATTTPPAVFHAARRVNGVAEEREAGGKASRLPPTQQRNERRSFRNGNVKFLAPDSPPVIPFCGLYGEVAMQGDGQAMACITAHPIGCPVLHAACQGFQPVDPTREGAKGPLAWTLPHEAWGSGVA